MVYEITLPIVKTATFSENPTKINTKVTLELVVVEEKVYLEPEIRYSGEYHLGEV